MHKKKKHRLKLVMDCHAQAAVAWQWPGWYTTDIIVLKPYGWPSILVVSADGITLGCFNVN